MMPVAAASSSGVFSQREHSTGTIVTATKRDMASENITTKDSCVNMMLAVPDRNSSGMNTAMCVSVEARMADQTSSLPWMAASSCPAHVKVAVRVLQHDDRRVHDQPCPAR
jgi:hypothetical protein